MKKENIKLLSNAIAPLIAIIAMTVSVLEAKNFNDRLFDPMLIGVIASAYAAAISVYYARIKEKRLQQRRIFIMYNYTDEEEVKKVVDTLREEGYNPWFDQDEILPGQKIHEAISVGISQSVIALLFISKNLDIQKDVISLELKSALSSMRSKDETFSPVIPILLDDTKVPDSLADVQWLSISDENFMEKLNKGLKKVLA